MKDTARPCSLDDLRLNADMRVDTEGKPLPADMAALAANPEEYFAPEGTNGGMGAFWWCTNQSCAQVDEIYYSFADAVAHVCVVPLTYKEVQQHEHRHQ